jgi:hypothetical protein
MGTLVVTKSKGGRIKLKVGGRHERVVRLELGDHSACVLPYKTTTAGLATGGWGGRRCRIDRIAAVRRHPGTAGL